MHVLRYIIVNEIDCSLPLRDAIISRFIPSSEIGPKLSNGLVAVQCAVISENLSIVCLDD